ncbi:MAG TPA: methylamine utilization protein [Rhodanobacteraceae bacterium]|nr:methylamine utilization protein [Rhodanobacteraceae bacterium]
MRYATAWLVFALGVVAGTASAGSLSVTVVDGRGRPVADSVITLTPDRPAAAPAVPAPPKTFYIDQKNETFIPYVQVFRPGDSVVFRNSDTTRHHVYSFSAIKQFEFVLRRGESSPPMVLDKTGIAAVGCNIHDHMITYLYVTAAPFVAMTGASGTATLDGLAAGNYTVRVWHPQLYPARPPVTARVAVGPAAGPRPMRFRLDLLPDPRMRMDHEHMDY